ncbi:sensor histidine kinase [Homoserinibacter sp. YIM 151385]|uniref:sensor histidine kinase n=1 Tax=Homoserinibacter sp. YIM 151385 TaxID=2985506 RepID=UPI0022F1436B|nr:ATP-binding protein [Homoserinibacter sp. YIM 151385]WBU38082.1 hypothetical protein OF852_00430 [Homoserinibacter sp. YIM 151385]
MRMRVAVLPRDVAAGVITGSLSRIGWAVGAVSLVLDIPVVVEVYLAAGQGDFLPLPVTLLLLQLGLLGFAAWWARPLAVVFYLLAGGAVAVGFQLEVMNSIPEAHDVHTFMLNRPLVALVLVGITSTSTIAGIGWLLVGSGVAISVHAITALIHGREFSPGLGPQVVLGLGLVAYLTFAAVQRVQRRRVPNFDELEAETQRLQHGEDLARRTTAAVHDTLLNDLSIIMNGPDRLDEAARQRLREDLDTLTSAEWLSTADAVVPADHQGAEIRNRIMRMVSDFQWRGLSVQVTGSGSGIYRLEDGVMEAVLGALRAALENALRHSGADVAQIVIAYEDDRLTVMVIDQGRGFDPRGVPEDRLGVRSSIVERIEGVGGRVSIWSTPGEGTSIVMTAPILETVVAHEPSRHRDPLDAELVPGLDPERDGPQQAGGPTARDAEAERGDDAAR